MRTVRICLVCLAVCSFVISITWVGRGILWRGGFATWNRGGWEFLERAGAFMAVLMFLTMFVLTGAARRFRYEIPGVWKMVPWLLAGIGLSMLSQTLKAIVTFVSPINQLGWEDTWMGSVSSIADIFHWPLRILGYVTTVLLVTLLCRFFLIRRIPVIDRKSVV